MTLSYSNERPLCFVHLPKSGGTSTRTYLQTAVPAEHLFPGTAQQDFRDAPPDINERYSVFCGHMDMAFWDSRAVRPYFFTLWRDPLDRLLSLYAFWRSHGPGHADTGWGGYLAPKLARMLSFDEFVRHRWSGVGCAVSNPMSRQIAWGIFSNLEIYDELLLELVIERLQGFALIGLTEQTDMTLRTLARLFDLPAPTSEIRANTNESLKRLFPKTHVERLNQVEPATRAFIASKNLVDGLVYDWIKEDQRRGNASQFSISTNRLGWAMDKLRSRTRELGGQTPRSIYYRLKAPAAEAFRSFALVDFVVTGGRNIRASRNEPTDGDFRIGTNGVRLRYPVVSCFDRVAASSSDKISIGANEEMLGVLPRQVATMISETVDPDTVGFSSAPMMYFRWEPSAHRCQTWTAFDIDNPEHARALDQLSAEFLESNPSILCARRSDDWYRERFLYPLADYGAAIVFDEQRSTPMGVVVFRVTPDRVILMDYIGGAQAFGWAIQHLAGIAFRQGASEVVTWWSRDTIDIVASSGQGVESDEYDAFWLGQPLETDSVRPVHATPADQLQYW